MRLGGWNLSDTCLSSAQAKARACAPSRTQRIKWVVKYLTLTLRWACRLRVSFAVAGVRYPITGYSSPKTIRVWHSIRRLLGLYPFVGNPRRSPVPQGKKLFSYDKLGFYFTVVRYLAFPAVCLFPLSLAVILGKHITATVTCCLQPSGWVATTYILPSFCEKSGNYWLFHRPCESLYPNAQLSTITAWDLRQLS